MATISFRACRAVALIATLAAAGVLRFRSPSACSTVSNPATVMVRFAVLGASFTALVIPWLKDTGLPWLKEKRLYSIVKKFVEAAEKQAEAGTIDKATKKRFVVELLEANGITVTPEIDAFIEAAVKELDLAEKNAIGEIGKIFSDAEQTPQN